MWLFTNNSFISVVQHRDKPDSVLVRARQAEHISALFPDKEIHATPDADYAFRIFITKQELKEVLNNYIDDKLTYPNFKSAQSYKNKAWLSFLHDIWALGMRYLQK